MRFLSFLLLLLLIACTTLKKPEVNLNTVTTTFLGGSTKDAYNIKLVFTKEGKFDFVNSTVTTQVTSLLPTERDEALKFATIRAKQKIFEFIKNTIETDRFISAIQNSIENSDAVPKHKGTPSNAKLALLVREDIRQKSDAILQGAYVADSVLDLSSGLIVVTVSSGRKNQ
jgi:hypothetical protein